MYHSLKRQIAKLQEHFDDDFFKVHLLRDPRNKGKYRLALLNYSKTMNKQDRSRRLVDSTDYVIVKNMNSVHNDHAAAMRAILEDMVSGPDRGRTMYLEHKSNPLDKYRREFTQTLSLLHQMLEIPMRRYVLFKNEQQGADAFDIRIDYMVSANSTEKGEMSLVRPSEEEITEAEFKVVTAYLEHVAHLRHVAELPTLTLVRPSDEDLTQAEFNVFSKELKQIAELLKPRQRYITIAVKTLNIPKAQREDFLLGLLPEQALLDKNTSYQKRAAYIRHNKAFYSEQALPVKRTYSDMKDDEINALSLRKQSAIKREGKRRIDYEKNFCLVCNKPVKRLGRHIETIAHKKKAQLNFMIK